MERWSSGAVRRGRGVVEGQYVLSASSSSTTTVTVVAIAHRRRKCRTARATALRTGHRALRCRRRSRQETARPPPAASRNARALEGDAASKGSGASLCWHVTPPGVAGASGRRLPVVMPRCGQQTVSRRANGAEQVLPGTCRREASRNTWSLRRRGTSYIARIESAHTKARSP